MYSSVSNVHFQEDIQKGESLYVGRGSVQREMKLKNEKLAWN
jgi:hypothetical protein